MNTTALAEQPFAEKKYMTVRGHQMAYIDEGEGIPIIFQHGNPTSSYLWRNVMPHLKGQGRLIALDLMGMGDSAKLPVELGKNRYSLAEQCRYFAEALEQLNVGDKVILVLHDCGSMVGFDWANKNRERVLGIAYMESIVAPLHITDFPDYVQEQAKHMTAENMEASLQHPLFLLADFLLKEREFSEFEKETYRKPFASAGEDCRPVISFDLPVAGTSITPDYSVKLVQDYSDWMAENDLPKLLIKAEPGYVLTGRLYNIAKNWKNQTETTVQGYHFVQETTPNEVGQAISVFVAGL